MISLMLKERYGISFWRYSWAIEKRRIRLIKITSLLLRAGRRAGDSGEGKGFCEYKTARRVAMAKVMMW